MKRKVVALTGGIGSGKSAVAGILRNMGYKTVDCDVLSKHIASLPQTVAQVEQLLGSEYVLNGSIDRKAVREKVFGNEKLLKQYQAIFFDGIKSLLLAEIEQTDGVVFVEIPILDAFDFNWDEIWLVDSELDRRISRVTVRDGVSQQNVQNIIAKQKQYGNPTRIITNNGNLGDLQHAVKQALVQSKLD